MSGVSVLAYSPDGATLYAGGAGLSLLDTTTGDVIRQRNPVADKYQVRDLAVSSDGKRVSVFGGTYRQTQGAPESEGLFAELAADLTAEPTLTPTRKGRQDNCGAVSADGRWLVTAGHAEGGLKGNTSVVVRDQKAQVVVRAFDAALSPHPKYKNDQKPYDISSVRFAYDSKLLAVSGSLPVELFDATDDFKPAGELVGHTDFVSRISFSEDGKLLASVSWDGTARIWDVKEKKELHSLQLKNNKRNQEAVGVAFSPDGKLVATVDSTEAKLWDTATGKEVRVLPTVLNGPSCVAFSPDGKHVAVGFADHSNPAKPTGGVEQFVTETGKARELKPK